MVLHRIQRLMAQPALITRGRESRFSETSSKKTQKITAKRKAELISSIGTLFCQFCCGLKMPMFKEGSLRNLSGISPRIFRRMTHVARGNGLPNACKPGLRPHSHAKMTPRPLDSQRPCLALFVHFRKLGYPVYAPNRLASPLKIPPQKGYPIFGKPLFFSR